MYIQEGGFNKGSQNGERTISPTNSKKKKKIRNSHAKE